MAQPNQNGIWHGNKSYYNKYGMRSEKKIPQLESQTTIKLI